jgi:hypothetical protein
MRMARGDDEIFRHILLQHEPHGPDVVAGKSPIPAAVETSEPQSISLARSYAAAAKVTLRVTYSGPRRGLS